MAEGHRSIPNQFFSVAFLERSTEIHVELEGPGSGVFLRQIWLRLQQRAIRMGRVISCLPFDRVALAAMEWKACDLTKSDEFRWKTKQSIPILSRVFDVDRLRSTICCQSWPRHFRHFEPISQYSTIDTKYAGLEDLRQGRDRPNENEI